MRAMSDSPELARLTGIDTERVVRATWIVGAGLAAAAGIFLAYDSHVETLMGSRCCFRSSPPRSSAASAGLRGDGGRARHRHGRGALHLRLDRFPSPLLPPGYKAGVAFAIMVAILIWRPSGLFRGRVF